MIQFRQSISNLLRVLKAEANGYYFVIIGALTWSSCEIILSLWELPGRYGILEIILTYPLMLLIFLPYMIPFYLGVWKSNLSSLSKMDILISIIYVLWFFAFLGPLPVEFSRIIYEQNFLLSIRYANIMAGCALTIFYSSIILVIRFKIVQNPFWSAFFGSFAAAVLSGIIVNYLCDLRYQWSFILSFFIPTVSLVVGYQAPRFSTLIANCLNYIFQFFKKLLITLKDFNKIISIAESSIKIVIQFSLFLGAVVLILGFILWLFLPSPSDELNAVSKRLCLERNDTLLSFPIKTLSECQINVSIPEFIFAKFRRSHKYISNKYETLIEIPVTLTNNSANPLKIRKIGEIFVNGANIENTVSGESLFIEFMNVDLPLTIEKQDNFVIVGSLKSIKTNVLNPVNNEFFSQLDNNKDRFDIITQMRWGKDWMAFYPARFSLSLKLPRLDKKYHHNITFLFPPLGEVYSDPKERIKEIRQIKIGDDMKKIRGLTTKEYPLKEIENELNELFSLDKSSIEVKLGQPLAKKATTFEIDDEMFEGEQWIYRCKSINSDANEFCIFYLNFYSLLNIGYEVEPINKILFENAYKAHENMIREKVKFKKDAYDLLGEPYWVVNDSLYYSLPAAPKNVLYRLQFFYNKRLFIDSYKILESKNFTKSIDKLKIQN